MILGDSLQVMASLAEREGLRGKVQCIYLDPPYGIKFNSNFQWSTTSRDVKDGKAEHITREPEQVRAFRDTWRDGIHSYLTYLRDRLTVARDLLTVSGSIFVQIGDENVHLIRSILDEVFGMHNFVSEIAFLKTSGAGSPAIGTNMIAGVYDSILWYARHSKYYVNTGSRIEGRHWAMKALDSTVTSKTNTDTAAPLGKSQSKPNMRECFGTINLRRKRVPKPPVSRFWLRAGSTVYPKEVGRRMSRAPTV